MRQTPSDPNRATLALAEPPHHAYGLMNPDRPVLLIPAVTGAGAPDARTRQAAAALQRQGLASALGPGVSWGRPVVARRRASPVPGKRRVRSPGRHPVRSSESWELLRDFSERLAQRVSQCLLTSQLALVIGGDHSCAVGTWSGVARALRRGRAGGGLGLLWVDAHLDAHTPRSSASKQPHGMPLAMLLGEGPPALTRLAGAAPVLQADRVVVLGARSWEPAEARRLARLGVLVITAEEVRAQGLADCMTRALQRVRGGDGSTLPWGLSLDVDAIDPQEAPATGTPEPDGLSMDALSLALAGLAWTPGLQALELTEYNPRLDPDCRTAEGLTRLLAALLAAPDRSA